MSNKTSDENVDSIENDVRILFNLKCYLESLLASGQDKIYYNDLLYDEKTIDCINALEDLLKERKKYTIRLTDKEYRRVIDIAQKDIAEQKDKRIQELERKNKHLSNTSDYETISLECTHLEEQLDIANSRIQELEEENRIFVLEGSKVRLEQYIKENFIPKQVVIDKMKELNKEMRNCDEIDAIFKIKQQQVLQELLETK